MKRILCFLVLTGFVAACAGNPPAWWNPTNRYGTAETSGQSAQTQTPLAQKDTPAVPAEESIDPLPDSSYEEEVIAPMPDEDDENDSGVSSSQNQELDPQELFPSVLEP